MSKVQQRPTSPCVLRVERTGNGYLLELHIPEDLLYVEGHFPHTPIIAGVCQLKWIIDYIQTYTGNPLRISAMKDVKFSRPLFPGQSCMLELIYVPQPASWHYQLYTDTQRFASGCLLVNPA
jgi:3-hydroxymyristoyl/3-hydroxydecanoyl-(acyl carrier protein) dehydratase